MGINGQVPAASSFFARLKVSKNFGTPLQVFHSFPVPDFSEQNLFHHND